MNIAILCFGISTIANPAGTEKVFVEMSMLLPSGVLMSMRYGMMNREWPLISLSREESIR